MSTTVKIEDVTKKYGDFTAIDKMNFTIKDGEFFTLLGPSGCGKTTLLRMIAGFNTIEAGNIYYNDKIINKIYQYLKNNHFIQLEKHKDNKRVVKNYSFESIYSLIKLLLLPLFLCHHNSYMLGKLCVEALADDIEGRSKFPVMISSCSVIFSYLFWPLMFSSLELPFLHLLVRSLIIYKIYNITQ